MRKRIALLLSVFYLVFINIFSCAYGAENNQPIRVYLNDDEVKFPSQQPTVVDRRTLIPLRGIFEKMGYSIEWEPNAKISTISSPLQTIVIRSGHKTMKVDNRDITLEVPAQIINESLMIPLRAVAESTGATVTWEANTKKIYVTSVQKKQVAVGIDDYIKQYSDIIDNLDRVTGLFKSLDVLSARNFSQKVETIQIQAENALENLKATKESLGSMSVPEQYAELHTLMTETVDTAINLCQLVYEMSNGTLDYAAASAEISSLRQKAESLNTEMNKVTTGLNQGIYR